MSQEKVKNLDFISQIAEEGNGSRLAIAGAKKDI
jgi:hypothetical protein